MVTVGEGVAAGASLIEAACGTSVDCAVGIAVGLELTEVAAEGVEVDMESFSEGSRSDAIAKMIISATAMMTIVQPQGQLPCRR